MSTGLTVALCIGGGWFLASIIIGIGWGWFCAAGSGEPMAGFWWPALRSWWRRTFCWDVGPHGDLTEGR